MTNKDIKYCKKHYTFRYINLCDRYVEVRVKSIQQAVINKLRDFLLVNLNGMLEGDDIECKGCFDFVKNTIHYIDYLNYIWHNEDTQLKVAQLINYLAVNTKSRALKQRKVNIK